MPLLKYRCHKIVDAFKIDRIILVAGDVPPDGALSAVLVSADPIYLADVDGAYMQKHAPTVGGYFIRYDDGYQSFSPAAPFVAGYSLLLPVPLDEAAS